MTLMYVLLYNLSQELLATYIQMQMLFHAKALELYTVAHRNLQNVSEDETLQVREIIAHIAQTHITPTVSSFELLQGEVPPYMNSTIVYYTTSFVHCVAMSELQLTNTIMSFSSWS